MWFFIVCIPKNYRHDLIGSHTHLGLLQHLFARRNPLSRVLLGLWCDVLNLCSPHSYGTAEKTSGMRLNKVKQYLLLHDSVGSQLWANVTPILRIDPPPQVIIQNQNHWTTRCAYDFLDLMHFQSPIRQHHFVDLFNCFGCSDLNWEFRTFSLTWTCATTTKYISTLFNHWNWWLGVPLVFFKLILGLRRVFFRKNEFFMTTRSLFRILAKFYALSPFNRCQKLLSKIESYLK